MRPIENELNIPELRSAFLRYTTEAFGTLPTVDHAIILDIGCGTGSSMLELAAGCNADIVGIDIDEAALSELRRKIESRGLSDRLKAINRSLLEVSQVTGASCRENNCLDRRCKSSRQPTARLYRVRKT